MKILRRLIYFISIFTFLFTLSCTQKSDKIVQAVTYDDKGNAWVGTNNGLYTETTDSILHLTPLPSLTHHPYPSIYAIVADSLRKRVWIGAWNHLYCYDTQQQRFVTIADSIIYCTVRLSLDSSGCVLAQTERGIFRFSPGDSITECKTEQLNNYHYGKPDITTIDTDNLHFEEKSHRNFAITTIAISAGIAIVIAFSIIIIKRTRKKQKKNTQLELAEDVPVLAPQPSFMEQAAKVVDEHLSEEDFSPEQFATEMAVSRAQLFRKLKSASGQTVKEFINERRMILAVKLLTTTNRTMDDIAAACGYGDTSTFRRLFSKRFNVTPSQYREKKITS